jgi:nucleotide-binding universal stress UspA family protein
MIQDIVVNLAIGRDRDPAADYAISVAKLFEAELAGVAFCYEPIITVATPLDAMPPDLIEAERVENAHAAEEAVTRFKKATADADLAAETRTVEASVGGAAGAFARLARTFDLTVAGQAEPKRAMPEDLIVEAALFESGRPVIIVPYIQKDALKLDRVMVCWDGSRTAARAVADAMPLLEFAKSIEVVTVSNGHGNGSKAFGAEEVAQHLVRHGLKAEIKPIVADGEVATTLLSHAADTSADVMVMGGYGHSRLREFILGGVTRGILGSMTIPVLMSH